MPQDHHGPGPVTIIVNARSHNWKEKDISFEQAVDLAYPASRRATTTRTQSATAAATTATAQAA
jgi:hypothetical protein